MTINHSILWSIFYFALNFYILLVFSGILYLIPNIIYFTSANKYQLTTKFFFINGPSASLLFYVPLVTLMLINLSWHSPELLVWFGHLIFSALQYKLTYLITLTFTLTLAVYLISVYFTSTEIYDYMIVIYNFFYFVLFLFATTNLLTFIFFVELLSTLVTLVLVTSLFSSIYSYNLTSSKEDIYFSNILPLSFLQTLLFFFWISLIASLNLFLFLIFFYLNIQTFDWFLLDSLFYNIVMYSSPSNIITLMVSWFILFFCILLKCGVVPFFFWKPTFFKGISLHALFFYITFYYYFLLLFLTIFLVSYVNDIFYYSSFVNYLVLMIGILFLFFILCESYYIKAFLALSSILNTLFIFLALSSYTTIDWFLFC